MKSLHKITALFVVFSTVGSTLMAQGSVPPPPIPPPPPGLPIDNWVSFFILVGLSYGVMKISKKTIKS